MSGGSRLYVRDIPPSRQSSRVMITCPARSNSLAYDVKPDVLSQSDRLNPGLLRSVVREERVRDILQRVSRTTVSCKAKHPELLKPEDTYTCCVYGNEYVLKKDVPVVPILTESKADLRFFRYHKPERATKVDTPKHRRDLQEVDNNCQTLGKYFGT